MAGSIDPNERLDPTGVSTAAADPAEWRHRVPGTRIVGTTMRALFRLRDFPILVVLR
jgi:hypothetical protein